MRCDVMCDTMLMSCHCAMLCVSSKVHEKSTHPAPTMSNGQDGKEQMATRSKRKRESTNGSKVD